MSKKTDISDQDVEDYLADRSEESALYQQTRDLKAPDHLSFTVKKMARDALLESDSSAGSGSASPRHQRYWPMAMAATVIVAVSAAVFYSTSLQVPETPKIADSQQPDNKEILALQEPIREQVGTADINELEQVAQSDDNVAPEIASAPAKEPNTQKQDLTQEQPRLALVDEPKIKTPGATPVRPKDTATPANDVRKDTHEVPEHLKELLQTASVNNQNVNGLPPADILRQWSQTQWVEQIKVLQKQDKMELADKYKAEFVKYFPEQDIQTLLNK